MHKTMKPTKEDLNQFQQYLADHKGEAFSSDTLGAVVTDEIREQERRLEARLSYSREYNHPPDLIPKREVAEEEI